MGFRLLPPLTPLMTLFKLPYADRVRFFESLPWLPEARRSLELLASGTAVRGCSM